MTSPFRYAGLYGRANGDNLIGVHALVRFLAGHRLHEILDGRHTRGTTDHHDVIDLLLVRPASLNGRFERSTATLDEAGRHLLELGSGEGHVKVLGTLARGGDERQVDLRLLNLAEFDLRLFGGFLQTLHGHLVGAEIDAFGVLEVLDEPIDDGLIPVVATQMGVAAGRLHFEDAIADFENGNVERAAAKVEHEDRLILRALFFKAVGERRGRGLVDDAKNFETSDLAGFFGGLALRIIEVRGHSDDRLGDGVAKVCLSVALELHERASADFLALYFLPSISTNQPVPMWRLTERMVRSGFVMAWRLATSPTSTSPDLEKPTIDGVVR